MRLHRFFIDEQLRNKKEVSIYEDDIIHQWKNVFRLHAGDRLILLDNSGLEYLSEIVLLAKGKAEIKILDQSAAQGPTKNLWLFASLIKKDNFEWILEKTTEIGISYVVPVISDRTEKKDLNVERAHKIIKEASEQSGRGVMPELHDVMDLEAAVKYAEENSITLIAFHYEGSKFGVMQRDLLKASEKIGALVGPEGGWTERELALFTEHHIPLYSLGGQILRAETAAIVITALLKF